MNLLDRLTSMLARRVIAATVTDADVGDGGRKGRMEDMDLIKGFAKWVAVANSRNAAAVASTPLRVMRRASFASAFEGKPVGGLEFRRLKRTAGPIARKALDMSEDVEEITDPEHPLVTLVRNVNPHMNHYDLLELTESHLGLAGDAFWLPLMGPNGWPVEIWPLAPNYVDVVPDAEAFISGYRYGRDPREREDAFHPASSVVHFKRPNPTGDPYRGFSDLQKCIDDANLSVKFTQFANAMIDNGMHPATMIRASKATKEQAREIERTLNAKHGGPERAGKAMVLYGALIEGIEKLNLTEGEVKFLQSDEKVREVIAAAHDMPVELLTLRPGGLGDGGEAMPQWMKFGVLPRLKRIEDKLNERLVPMFKGLGSDLFLVFDSPVEDDEASDEKRAIELYASGLVTQNEARLRINMPAVEGGDEFGGQAAMDPFAAFSAGMGGGLSLGGGGLSFDKPGLSFSDPGGGLSLGGAGSGGAPRLALPQPPQRMTLDYLNDPWSGKALGDPVWTKADDRGANRRISGVEASMAAALRGWFRENVPEIVRRVHADGVNLREPEFLGGFLRAVDEPLGDTVRSAFGFGVAEVRSRKDRGSAIVTKDDDLIGGNVQSVLNILERERLRLADSVMQSLEHVIRANLRTGLAAGESVGELQQRVADALGKQADYAAERIARTETRRAFMVGRQEGWADTGVVAGKRWRLSSNPCPICVEIAARYSKALLNEPFVPMGTVVAGRSLDFRPVMGGDAHPNDRCSIEPILEGEDD